MRPQFNKDCFFNTNARFIVNSLNVDTDTTEINENLYSANTCFCIYKIRYLKKNSIHENKLKLKRPYADYRFVMKSVSNTTQEKKIVHRIKNKKYLGAFVRLTNICGYTNKSVASMKDNQHGLTVFYEKKTRLLFTTLRHSGRITQCL